MTFPHPKGVFFDWDGTLADSFSFLEAAHNDVLKSFDKPPFEQGGFKHYFGKPREEIYPALYGEKNAAEAQARFEVFVQKNHTTMLKRINGAEEVLKTLSDMGMIMGVVSNKKPEFVNAEINHFEWRKYFSSVVGAKEAENDKPSPDPIILGVQRASLEPNMGNIWYVGDTKIDFLASNAAQCPVIIIGSEVQDADIRNAEVPAKKFETLAEFNDFLLQYAQNEIQQKKA
ncbi:MAG: HAD family hydrolase [Pseudomonadota bacterium]